MKKIILFLILICLPLVAEEIWLGVVVGMEGDSLLLVDGPKIYVPGLSAGKFINENDRAVDMSKITFPLNASLVIDDRVKHLGNIMTESGIKPEYGHLVKIKIHAFYDIKDGRLVEKQH